MGPGSGQQEGWNCADLLRAGSQRRNVRENARGRAFLQLLAHGETWYAATVGKPCRAAEADPLYQERVSIEGEAVGTWEEHARAQGRTKMRLGGLVLRFFFALVKKLKPRDRERLYYFICHPEDVTPEDVAQVLRVLESKG